MLLGCRLHGGEGNSDALVLLPLLPMSRYAPGAVHAEVKITKKKMGRKKLSIDGNIPDIFESQSLGRHYI